MQNDVRAKVIQVIEVEHYRNGDAAGGTPARWVKTYWDLKGNLLGENDPYLQEAHHAGAPTGTDYMRRAAAV
jgi:hypothetical protein